MSTPSPLLIGLAAAFAGLMALALLLLRLDAANKKRQQRIAAVVQPHWRAAAPPRGRGGFRRACCAAASATVCAGSRVSTSTGWRTTQTDWWLVVILALPVARVATGLLATLVGEWLVWLTPVLWLILVRGYFSWLQEQRLEHPVPPVPGCAGDDRPFGTGGHTCLGGDPHGRPRFPAAHRTGVSAHGRPSAGGHAAE